MKISLVLSNYIGGDKLTRVSITQSYTKHPPGHGVGALVVLASSSVAAVRLDQLLKTRDSKLDAVVAAQTPDRRQLSALWQAHLVPDQRVRLGDRQLGLADVLLQHLALLPAQLARPLCPLVAEGEGGVADGWDGELRTPGRHVWRK